MDLGIKGRRALVVGASKGMGLAAALALAEAGCHVAAVSRSSDLLGALKPLLGESGWVCGCDVMSAAERAVLMKRVRIEFGEPDIVVHVTGGSVGIRDAMSPVEDMQKVWMANLGYAHEINRAFLPGMAERGWGRIVHFSSNGVKLATGNVPYISSKAAVESYVKNMSRQYSAKGVVMTCVAPGPIETRGIFMYDQDEAWTRAFFEKYVPMNRWGQASEVGGLVAFLCSEQASYMAGAVVPVDGGMR